MKNLVLVIIISVFSLPLIAQTSVSIIVTKSLLDNSITRISIEDVQQLLGQASGSNVMLNDATAEISIVLPEINDDSANWLNRFAQQATFPYRNFPAHDYSWIISTKGKRITYTLKAMSFQGVSFALYGLLQEHLGFRFYHVRQSIIPHWANGWPEEKSVTFSGKALFDKKGFHLHTQHPLELTEQLLDPTVPNALYDVKQYIDWLVRNGENYFEFCLLNDVDKKHWPAHAKAFVDYAHSRGILVSVDLSLHMIQQKSYQLYKGPVNEKKQVEHSLQWLMQANWDFLDVEFSTTEFSSGNKKKKEEMRQFVLTWLQQHTRAKLTGRQHVVKNENEIGHKRKDFIWDSTSIALDKQRGVLAHTVMFYDMTEPNAPVYQNNNQRHMFEFLLSQMKERETWYFPESAYWITFDNSLPVFLLPYLSARLSDIDTCVKYNVPGHITFSSGWEWGYWLFDWSIARWSWQYSYDGVPETRNPTMYASQMSAAKEAEQVTLALQQQQQYLKDSALMKWMTAMTVADEIGIKAISKEYEPRPDWSYKFLERKADAALIKMIGNSILPQLKEFAEKQISTADKMKQDPDSVSDEWRDGVAVTGLRALHRYYTLQYILTRRQSALDKRHFDGDSLLKKAAEVRATAQLIVNLRQQHYRYAVSALAGKHWEHTAYHFGYLYPAGNLHLWYREEEEARLNKYSPFFMNIWNLWRIAGVIK